MQNKLSIQKLWINGMMKFEGWRTIENIVRDAIEGFDLTANEAWQFLQ